MDDNDRKGQTDGDGFQAHMVAKVKGSYRRLRRYDPEMKQGIRSLEKGIYSCLGVAGAVCILCRIAANYIPPIICWIIAIVVGGAALALAAVIMFVIQFMRAISVANYEDRHCLTLGKVIGEKPYRLIVLAGLSLGRNPEMKLEGLRHFTVAELPDQPLHDGGYVPVVMGFSAAEDEDLKTAERWAWFHANPVCWVTGDQDELARCKRWVTEDSPELLQQLDELAASERVQAMSDTTMLIYGPGLEYIDSETVKA